MQTTAGAIPTIIDALPSRLQASVAKMPDPKQSGVQLQDLIFRAVARFFAFLVLAILLAIIASLAYGSLPAMQRFGLGFLIDSEWNPVTEQFGALVPIVGTLVTSCIALLIGVPVSFGIALFLTELSPPWLKRPLGTAIELLAAIPSIIYGMWGLFVLAPLFADHVQPWLINTIGAVPVIGALFKGPPQGIGVFTAGFVLAIMVIPFIASVMRDVFDVVPPVLRNPRTASVARPGWSGTSSCPIRGRDRRHHARPRPRAGQTMSPSHRQCPSAERVDSGAGQQHRVGVANSSPKPSATCTRRR
jgi:ABC-type phosphate transport system permease subunit